MNVTAHRTIGKPTPPVDPNGPGPRPPPKHLSARALTTGYPNPDGPENAPGGPWIPVSARRWSVR